MKKIVIFVISAALCVLVLCSCVPNGNGSDSDSQETKYITPVADKPPLFTD